MVGNQKVYPEADIDKVCGYVDDLQIAMTANGFPLKKEMFVRALKSNAKNSAVWGTPCIQHARMAMEEGRVSPAQVIIIADNILRD